MIAGLFHEGSGLGDQLFRYVTVRTLAEEKGFDWGMMGTLKGDFFFEQPQIVTYSGGEPARWSEKDVKENGVDIRSYDPEINFVEDNTVIDGSFEDSKYWGHNLDNINRWLAVEPLEVSNDTCVVGFRGGEYALSSDLFLPQGYYEKAISHFTPRVEFEVHTDDTHLAMEFFSSVKANMSFVKNEQISHSQHSNMGFNWRSMRHAKYAIIPNSAFFILPRLLKHHEDPTAVTIAPRYWARHNTKVWARPACYYKAFTYLHAEDTYTNTPNMEA
jgi:hypothetical protein